MRSCFCTCVKSRLPHDATHMEYGVGVLCVLCVAYSVIYNINVSFYELITGILVGGEKL